MRSVMIFSQGLATTVKDPEHFYLFRSVCISISTPFDNAFLKIACNGPKQLVGGDLEAICTARTLRLKTSTVAHFRQLQRYLQEQGLKFHTFAMTTERLLKVVIKGLPATLSPEEVVEAFQGDGYGIVEAKLLKTRRGQPTSLWLITLRGGDGLRPPTDVYTARTLFFCRLEVR
ncbi:hypothetical protein J6590_104502, partial [Homalodisca vitripennis]